MHADLLESIYDAALDPSRWAEAVMAVARSCDSDGGELLLWDELRGTTVSDGPVGPELPDPVAARRLYGDYYGAIDPRRQHLLTLPVGTWLACHHICDDRFVARSEFYQDYSLPVLGTRYIGCVRLADRQGMHAMLAIARLAGPRARPFDDEALRGLTALTPHLQRAARLHLQIARLDAEVSLRDGALDRLSTPMFMTDEDGRILFVNRAGDDLLRMPGKALRGKAGRLEAATAADDVRLGSAIRQAVLGAVGASLLVGAFTSSPVLCTVIPLGERSSHLSGARRPVAMILVGDRRIDGAAEQAMLREIFGLTPAEARLALSLAAGDAVADHAQANGLSIHTVRAQLQAVFLKLGVNRQGAVVSMLQRLLPPVRPGD